MPTTSLTDRDRRILDFARQWWRYEGARRQAIRDEFGISAVRFDQILNALIDTESAVVHDPVLVHRLQDRRDARLRQRSLRRLVA